jgi:plastocyanin
MSRLSKLIGPTVAAAALAVACGGSGADQSASAKPASPAAAPAGKKVDPSTAGTISGTVTVDGKLPENPVIKMASDPACAADHKDGVSAENYVTSNGGLENVFVYIKEGLDKDYSFATPTDTVKLDQKGCQYIPHVVGVRVGQPLQIVNDDSTMHNVHGLPETNQEFNFGQPVAGMKNVVTFTAPEVMIPFKCDVHSWMHAYIGVVNNPYFAVTGGGGTFELKDVPPGTYTIEAWHEKLGHSTQTVTLGNKDSKKIRFSFKADGAAAAGA